jgi:transcriptional regulator with XRE-family HTH domain
MNAAEARKRRGGSTLVERARQDADRAARIDKLVAEASVEHALQELMEIENVTAAELARRVKSKPPQISRDLHGGLSKARVSRLVRLARALGYDFVPVFIPRDEPEEREHLLGFYRKILTKTQKAREAAQGKDTHREKIAI